MHKAIILITDSEECEGEAIEATKLAAEKRHSDRRDRTQKEQRVVPFFQDSPTLGGSRSLQSSMRILPATLSCRGRRHIRQQRFSGGAFRP